LKKNLTSLFGLVYNQSKIMSRSAKKAVFMVRVTGLRVFASFEALYQALPLEACGCTEADIQIARRDCAAKELI
jgi:ASC-1-like (ASCH) protein